MLDYLEQEYNLQDPNIISILDEVSLWSARFGIVLLDNLELMANINVLDVGCGSGFPLFELAHIHGPSCEFTGVDISEEALARARQKQKLYNLHNIKLLKTDGLALALPDSHFDLIVSNLGLNNFENPQAVLTECFRVARPGDRLVLTTNLKGHLREFYAVFDETLVALGETHALPKLADNENHRGTRESVYALVQAVGFRIVKIIEDSFYLYFSDGSSLLRHFLVKIGFLPGWRQVVAGTSEEKVFTELERRLNQLANQNNILKMTIPRLYLEACKN